MNKRVLILLMICLLVLLSISALAETLYTGKWIREDGSYGPYTPEELRDNYTPQMAGVWVWETVDSGVIINYYVYDGGSSAHPAGWDDVNNVPLYGGAMSAGYIEDPANDSFTIPSCGYFKPNYTFAYWCDKNPSVVTPDNPYGTIIHPGDVLPAGTFSGAQILNLYAVFEPENTNLNFHNGEAEFTLKGGESLTITGLPGGAVYEVQELSEAGWVRVDTNRVSGEITAADMSNAIFVNQYSPTTATVQIIGQKWIDGNIPQENSYQFNLINMDTGEVIDTKFNTATGMIVFDTLVFTDADEGSHTYKMVEIRGDDNSIAYDAHEEFVTIDVSVDSGNVTAVIRDDGSSGRTIPQFNNDTKPGSLTFTKYATGNVVGDETFVFEVHLTNTYGRPLDENTVTIITPSSSPAPDEPSEP